MQMTNHRTTATTATTPHTPKLVGGGEVAVC